MKPVKQHNQIAPVKTAEYSIDITAGLNSDLVKPVRSLDVFEEFLGNPVNRLDDSKNITNFLSHAIVYLQVKFLKVVSVKNDLPFPTQGFKITLK